MMKLSQKKLTDTYSQSKSIPKSPTKGNIIKRKGEPNENNLFPHLEFRTDVQAARKVLHTSKPTELPGRESQIHEVYEFVKKCLTNKVAGSMYISGAPGTGKTAVVQHVLDKLEKGSDEDTKSYSFSRAMVNCMSVKTPTRIYEVVVTQLKTKIKGDSPKEIMYNRVISKSSKMIVLVLDEMDQLIKGRSTEIIYSLFDWARRPESKLILLGIANSLDLTVRHLPMLTSSPIPSITKSRRRIVPEKNLKPDPEPTKLLQFRPYERSEIEHILEMRLGEIGSEIFDPAAIKFAAAKVAASTGDMRKALNACKMALEAAEKNGKHSNALKTTSDDGFNASSPKKVRCDRVGVAALSKVLGAQKDDGPLPLQQMVVLFTLLRINRCAPNSRQSFDGVSTPIPISFLYDEYRKVCSSKGFSWIDRSEISSVCYMLQDRSHVTVIEGGPSSGTFKKISIKKQTSVIFDPKAAEVILKNTDLKSLID